MTFISDTIYIFGDAKSVIVVHVFGIFGMVIAIFMCMYCRGHSVNWQPTTKTSDHSGYAEFSTSISRSHHRAGAHVTRASIQNLVLFGNVDVQGVMFLETLPQSARSHLNKEFFNFQNEIL